MKNVEFDDVAGTLSMTVDVLRVTETRDLVHDAPHLEAMAFWGCSDEWPYDSTAQKCRQCPGGECRHAYPVNDAGHVYGLVEFDSHNSRRQAFDCVLLFENDLKSIAPVKGIRRRR